VQVYIYRASQGISHYQRGRSQIVGAHMRVDAPLEVAIPAEHRRRHEVGLLHGLGDWRCQRAAVADAGGAAVADHVKT